MLLWPPIDDVNSGILEPAGLTAGRPPNFFDARNYFANIAQYDYIAAAE
jgi:hypothetical protein